MADTKISAGADPGTLVATDKLPLARSASTTAYAATVAEIATYANGVYAPNYYTGSPAMDGTAAPGSVAFVSRGDHRHPTDASLLSKSGGTMTGALTLAADPAAALQAATKQYVDGAAAAGVTSWNTRTGGVTLTLADVTGVGGAPLASPVFTGNPTAPTPTAGDSDTSIATTAFVANAVSAGTAGVASFNTRTGAVTLTSGDVTTALTFTPYNATNPSGYQTAAQVTTTLAPYALTSAVLPLAGGTMTGDITLGSGAVLFERQAALGAGTAIAADSAAVFTKTISGVTTFTVTGTPASGAVSSFMLDLTNGGSAAITWWSGMKWAGGTAPTLTTAGRDLLGFMTYDAGTTWTGMLLAKDAK